MEDNRDRTDFLELLSQQVTMNKMFHRENESKQSAQKSNLFKLQMA